MVVARIASLLTLLSLAGTMTTPVGAQTVDLSPVEILAGATFFDTSTLVEGASRGWIVGAGWNATHWLALDVAMNRFDLAQTVTFLDIDARFRSLMVGPRLTWRRHLVQPFAQMSIGRTWIDLRVRTLLPFESTADSDEAGASVQVGGGIELPLPARLRARIAYDYRRVVAVDTFRQHGVSVAIAYRLGGS